MNAHAHFTEPQAAEDARFMALALTLGRRALGNCWPNPAVGALVVRTTPNGPVIAGRGWTCPGGRPHAETEALQRAGADATGATLYTTLEPCAHHGRTPPCVNAILAAGITRVVSALEDPNPDVAGRGHALLRAGGVTVAVGEGAVEARRAHAGHIRRIRDGRPQITLKLAVSADGKVAETPGHPTQISGEPARARTHRIRAMHDAIMIGIGTVLADDPALTCRLPGMLAQSPRRVILDRTLRLPLDGILVRTARETPVVAVAGVDASAERERNLRANGVDVVRVGVRDGRLDLAEALTLFGTLGFTRVLTEGGPTVAASLLTADLVDEAVLVHSPRTLGSGGVDALAGMPLTAITRARKFRAYATETAGDDVFDSYERA